MPIHGRFINYIYIYTHIPSPLPVPSRTVRFFRVWPQKFITTVYVVALMFIIATAAVTMYTVQTPGAPINYLATATDDDGRLGRKTVSPRSRYALCGAYIRRFSLYNYSNGRFMVPSPSCTPFVGNFPRRTDILEIFLEKFDIVRYRICDLNWPYFKLYDVLCQWPILVYGSKIIIVIYIPSIYCKF